MISDLSIKFPEYDPILTKIGRQDSNNEYKVNWDKSLSVYKTSVHDKDMVYAYIAGNSNIKKINNGIQNIIPDHNIFAVIIYDRYPKSLYHLLLLPVINFANNPSEFRREHIKLLKSYHNTAKMIAKDLENKYNCEFLIGYHSKPSMCDLHIHIISNDFKGSCLKNEEQKRTYTDPKMFYTCDFVEKKLEEFGYL